jgi:hypothetical protein
VNVVDRHREALGRGMRARDGSEQVRRERSNAALAWQVVPNECNLADFRGFFQVTLSARTTNLLGAEPTK